jgi:hypothetical protein
MGRERFAEWAEIRAEQTPSEVRQYCRSHATVGFSVNDRLVRQAASYQGFTTA